MKNGDIVERAWNHLRAALLWARKRQRVLLMDLKRLGQGQGQAQAQAHYYERELSFDDTPIFRMKMHRLSSMRFHLPHIPCINPQVDFNEDVEYDHVAHSSPMSGRHYCGYREQKQEEAEIDERAEEFIARFYQQMKLQRQISYLQYNESHKGVSS